MARNSEQSEDNTPRNSAIVLTKTTNDDLVSSPASPKNEMIDTINSSRVHSPLHEKEEHELEDHDDKDQQNEKKNSPETPQLPVKSTLPK